MWLEKPVGAFVAFGMMEVRFVAKKIPARGVIGFTFPREQSINILINAFSTTAVSAEKRV
jgi:hypothetical protein